jgi:redox-sensitive bicupin YhaK (pirin superfamily)
MTRTDVDVEPTSAVAHEGALEIISPREVPLGGPRAMTVRRTLPSRGRTMVGAWCFLDHYGPDRVSDSGGMSVPPHPHIGLQTVSWLFAGEIEHRDSTGVTAMVTPKTLNLMTAGRGIQHSEVSTPATDTLHGVQLWVALPESARHQNPHFDARPARAATVGDGVVTLFLGSLADVGLVRAPTYSPLMGAQIDLPPGGEMTLRVSEASEYGFLVDQGSLTVLGDEIARHHLGVTPTGHHALTLKAGDAPVRAVMIGGEPLGEPIVMWWNFVGRTHQDIVSARTDWQENIEEPSARFGRLDHLPALPAPALPSVTLRPRL